MGGRGRGRERRRGVPRLYITISLLQNDEAIYMYSFAPLLVYTWMCKLGGVWWRLSISQPRKSVQSETHTSTHTQTHTLHVLAKLTHMPLPSTQ